MTLSLVRAMSSGLHTVTEITPAINPEKKSRILYFCCWVSSMFNIISIVDTIITHIPK